MKSTANSVPPSRIFDLIYWMSRYVERAGNTARFIDVNLQLVLDAPPDQEQQWQPLVNATGDQEAFAKRYGLATQDNVIEFLAFDEQNPDSIVSCLHAAQENAGGVRAVISSEMWLQLNKFYLMVKHAAVTPMDLDMANEFFHDVKISSHLFASINYATMSHDASWHFSNLGRLLERADQVSRVLDSKYDLFHRSPEEKGSAFDQLQWRAVLRSASAFEMYGKRHGLVSPREVIEFLMLDREFPRSIQFCLRSGLDSLHAISGTPPGTFRSAPEKLLGLFCADLEYATVDDIISFGLHEYIDQFQKKLNRTAQAISERFFAFQLPPLSTTDPTISLTSNI